jgi:histidinol phosphatase-like PHP family hydrolase
LYLNRTDHWKTTYPAVEIDADPDRQDLSMDLVTLANNSGCRISLGTDAHDPLQLRFMEYALASAVKAGVPKERILNFMNFYESRLWVAQLRDARPHVGKADFGQPAD